MVVVKISDGLGNQMFQYALGRSVALKKGEVLKLDTTPFNKNYKLRAFLLEKFHIENSNFSFMQKIKYNIIYRYVRYAINKINSISYLFPNIYKEKKTYEYDQKVFTTKSSYFSGYWQDHRYFKAIRANLLKEFILKKKLNDKNQTMLDNIKNTNSVSMHVRRSDYLTINGKEVCNLEYYYRVADYMREHVVDPVFFIFSDDIDWVKQNLLIDNAVYIDFNNTNPEFDLELMKNCKHNIIANSTFSWWGAWLNNNKAKIVIEPYEWKKGTATPTGLIDTNWILL